MKKQMRFGSIVLSIPYSSRWSIVLSALLIVLISVTSLSGGRVRAATRDCIQLEDEYTNRSYYDVVTGNKLLPPFTFDGSGVQTVFPSPDARYIAYLWQADTTLATRFSLFIKLRGASNHTARLLQSNLNEPNFSDFRDIRWSPDGHFIAYRWNSDDGTQYIAISDTDGNQIARRVLDHVPENVTSVNLHGWSADGKYLAVSYHTDLSMDDPTLPTTIYILSAPTLRSIETPLLISNMRPRNTGGDNRSLDTYDMVQWSAFGDWLDYLTTKPDAHDTLTLYSPDTGQMLTAETSATSVLDFPAQVLWSPDGKHVAVLTARYIEQASDGFVTWKIDIFGIDGSIFYRVSDNALPSIFQPTPRTLAEFKWSSDSRSLIYPQGLAAYENMPSDLVAFNLDRKQAILLRSSVYLSPSITFDHRYIVASWDEGNARKIDIIDIIDTTTLRRITTLDALYNATPAALYNRVYGDAPDQVFVDYSPQSGWLIVSEDGTATWAVNVRTGVQRPLLPDFPAHYLGVSFIADNRFVGGLKTYSPEQVNSDYHVLALDDGTFHNFHLPPSIVDPILIDYSPEGEVTLSSIDAVTNQTLISILRSDSSIRRQFTAADSYTSIGRTNCEPK